MVNFGTPSDGLMATRLPTINEESVIGGGCGGVSRQSATERRKALRKRLPTAWFKTSLPTGDAQVRYNETRSSVHEHGLHTVCEEARCPNVHDCWGRGTATFMVAGEVCTRGCRFCAVGTEKIPPALDASEPSELAEVLSRMGLDHAVITVVNRDDLQDGGAGHYRDCILAVNERCAECRAGVVMLDLMEPRGPRGVAR